MKAILNLFTTMVGRGAMPIIAGTCAGTKLGYDLFKIFNSTSEPFEIEEKTGEPKVNKKENFATTIITVELPGVSKDNITISAYTNPIAILGIPAMMAQQGMISLNETELYITAKRDENTTYKTTITVNNACTDDDINASYANGLLTITADKPGITNIPVV